MKVVDGLILAREGMRDFLKDPHPVDLARARRDARWIFEQLESVAGADAGNQAQRGSSGS